VARHSAVARDDPAATSAGFTASTSARFPASTSGGLAVTRLAVAVRPPDDILAVVRALPRPPLPEVTWSAPERWIVKVRPLGHVAVELVDPLLEALADELQGAPPVRCRMGPATIRPGGQWLAVPVSGLEEIGEVVFAATTPIVPVTHPQPFHAEIPLASGRVPRELGGVPLQASWTADTLVLVADRSAPGRPKLVDVGEIPLDGELDG
jgi:hypothetical protein